MKTQTTPPTENGNNTGTTGPEVTNPEQTTPEEIVPPAEEENVTENITENTMPTKLPKTGTNIYLPIFTILVILTGTVIYYNKKKINAK